MELKQVIIYKTNCSYSELKSISSLLKSDEIKQNGKIIIKCNLECSILDIRKQIKEILNCSYSDILCTYAK